MIEPYSKITTIAMWTDEYISKQMLDAHLNPDHDGASRKPKTINKTVELLKQYIRPIDTICDFGCGPGLYTNLLSNHAKKVIGVDVSNNSLEYAKSQNDQVEYINLNYIKEKIPHKIDVGYMIYCDFGALPPLSQQQVLSNIHSQLNTGGFFIFDVFSEHHFKQTKELYTVSEEEDGFFMSGHSKVTHKVIKYPKLHLTLNYQKAVGNRNFEVYNWDKCYSIEEIKYLLHDNGFELVEYYSDPIGGKQFKENDVYMLIARKVQK